MMTNDQLTGLLHTLLSAVEEQRMVIDKLVEKGVLTVAERKEISRAYAAKVEARRTAILDEEAEEAAAQAAKTDEPASTVRRRALHFRS